MKNTASLASALALLSLLCGPMTAHSAHPLITEDTGTQGAGNFQLELTQHLGRNKDAGSKTSDRIFNAILSYGLAENLDVIAALPYEHSTEWSGTAKTLVHGFADMEVAAKWRFYDDGRVSLALRPGLVLPTGNEDKGLSSEHIIPSLFGVMTYAIEPWSFHLHLGYTRNFHDGPDQREHIHHASAAAEFHVGESVRLVADASLESNPDLSGPTNESSIVLGLIYSIAANVDIDLGYRKGLSDASPDKAWLLGLTLFF
jgi:Putative MetA-pathway of phenol degradation